MTKLVDPDSYSIIVNGSPTTEEVSVDTGLKTVQLRVAGNLNDTAPGKSSGGTGKSIYSFLKEEWLSNTTLRRFKFPIKMIYEGSFIWVNGWAPKDQQTRDLCRDAGFLEQATGRQNACVVSLGAIHAPGTDLAYYQNVTGFTASVTNFDKTGELNENIMIHDGGATDRTGYLKNFLRVQGKEYAEYNLLTEQGLSSLTYQAYRLPLVNKADQKVAASDASIDADTPYTGMKINYLKGVGFTTWANSTVYPAAAVVKDNTTGRWKFTTAGGTSSGTSTADDIGVTWVAYDGEIQIGSLYYACNRVVTCNSGTAQQIHEFCQRQLRKTSDINANDTTSVDQQGFGNVNGNVAKYLTVFVGENLKPAPGVKLSGFDTNSTNNIQHSPITVDGGGLDSEKVPVTFAEVSYPFVAAGTFAFSSNLVSQPDAQTVFTPYFEYITTTTGTNISISGVSGATAVLGWTGTTLDHLTNGDYVKESGWVTTGNNGLWLVGAVDTGANTAAVTKLDGLTIANEAATPSVTVLENPFESPGAVTVKNNAGTDMGGQITSASIAWDFDYTNNAQGGRTPNTSAAIHIVAMALDGAEWTESTHTITAATGQSIPVNSPDERNYSNPV